jgi:hypothetical protein
MRQRANPPPVEAPVVEPLTVERVADSAVIESSGSM